MKIMRLVSPEWCDEMIKATAGQPVYAGTVRVEGRDIQHRGRTALEHGIASPHVYLLHRTLTDHMKRNATWLRSMQLEGVRLVPEVRLLSYDEGSQYVAHTDRSHDLKRVVSSTLFLNDDYEGGNLWLEGEQVKLPAGWAVVFDSRTRHSVTPVTAGTRWVAVGFLREDS